MLRKNKRLILKLIICLMTGLCIIAVLLCFGVIQINRPSYERYPVRGVDVSRYQGEIDWEILFKQGIKFAYIKATEGSSHIDERFTSNWEQAQKTALRIGAYHFFSMDSPGEKQAELFCSIVTPVQSMLPPVIDFEPYGRYTSLKDLDTEALASELEQCLATIQERYDLTPIIYTTQDWYPFIHERFPYNDIWIRSVYGKPGNDIGWTFWQYSNRTKLEGYTGTERYIDMDAFCGSVEEFNNYQNSNAPKILEVAQSYPAGDSIEFPVDISLMFTKKSKPINSNQAAIELAMELIGECHKKGQFSDFTLLAIVHSEHDNMWYFEYSIDQQNENAENLVDCGNFNVAVDGSAGNIIRAWIEEKVEKSSMSHY